MNRVILKNGGSARKSAHINRLPAVNLHHATRFCDPAVHPLNRFVTINFGLTSCVRERVSRTFQKLLAQRFAPWFRRSMRARRRVPPTYVWTIEAAGGVLAVHWLVHAPPRETATFEQKLQRWLVSLLKEEIAPRVVKVGSMKLLIGLRRYILKGVKPVLAAHLGVVPVDQGEVIGKRSGLSRNLGPETRKRSGYRPRRPIV